MWTCRPGRISVVVSGWKNSAVNYLGGGGMFASPPLHTNRFNSVDMKNLPCKDKRKAT